MFVFSFLPGVVSVADAALVLTFADSAGHAAPVDNSPCSSIAWSAGSEMRWCDPGGTYIIEGGYGKNAMNGGETWSFNDAGVFTGVTGTSANIGAEYAPPGSVAPLPGTNPTLQMNTEFLGGGFSVLAPTQGSLAGNAYGTGLFVGGVPAAGNDLPFIYFPVLEAQFNGSAWLKLGSANGGINFLADISNVTTLGNTTTFDFHLHASETIDGSEQPVGLGYDGFSPQWELQGTGTYVAPVPVPAAVWLFGSGLLGLIGAVRRKKKG